MTNKQLAELARERAERYPSRAPERRAADALYVALSDTRTPPRANSEPKENTMIRTSMRPVRVRLRLAHGPGPEIDAYPAPAPGLVIHRTFGQPDDVYTITQQHTGAAVCMDLPSPEAALGLAADLGTFADWTQPVDVTGIHASMRGAARRWGWEPQGGQPEGLEWFRAAGVIL